MPTLRKPSPGAVRAFITARAPLVPTYPDVGATATGPPAGYAVDHARGAVGEGERAFRAARAALGRWKQFDLGWVEAVPADTPLATGACVGVLARVAGLWWLNACRIVYTVDEVSDTAARFGFAYGTLPGHAASGEERFLIEWDRIGGSVSYDIVAFSRPTHPLARLGYPLMRRTQKRFGHDSVAAMARAVASG
ncbi:DUF1990 domain-containing protein [Gemmata sp. JC673]|uniref:DUF1990 domain-containing protein n=1 Tax=Gemmata algarum TaxID=2975278 RepID=A0ABU5F3H7_9BACT|nr:DUF1990 domain-containing protein [Gemmata algarum]MDY3562128.1 DUF1990 domain-containing protein [Gemmata algarum]